MPDVLHVETQLRLFDLTVPARLLLAAAVGLMIAFVARPQTADVDFAPLRTIESIAPVTGFALVAHHISRIDLYHESIDRIADLGANAMVIVTPVFQRTVDSTEIRVLENRCPTESQLVALFTHARKRGLHTTLIPIVLIEEIGDKEWRGVIEPDDWDAWWKNYTRQMQRFTRLATLAHVDLLSVGSELNSTQSQTERWRTLIARIRNVYDGQLMYSGNWDRYERVEFWDDLDVIGVSAYFELVRDNPGADVNAIAEAWAPHRRDLIRFAERQNEPLLLSEIGYPSLPWANAHPWDYINDDGLPADHAAQARCWQAFFDAWTPTLNSPDPAVAGFFCYHWDPYHSGRTDDTGYGVHGKPAQAVIQRGFKQLHLMTEPSDH